MNNSHMSEIPMIANISINHQEEKKKNINTLNVSIQDSEDSEETESEGL